MSDDAGGVAGEGESGVVTTTVNTESFFYYMQLQIRYFIGLWTLIDSLFHGTDINCTVTVDCYVCVTSH